MVAASAGSLFATKNTAPNLRLEFHTQGNEDRAVHDFFVQFAHTEGFSVDDATPKMPPKNGRPVFNLELRRDNTATVNVMNILRADQFLVFFYERKRSAESSGIESRLMKRLKEKWPSTRPYRGM